MNESPSTRADHRGIRLGVISNPHSGRNRRQISQVCAILGAAPGISHVVTASSDDIGRAIIAMQRDAVNLIALNGGDGSVAQALGAIVANRGDNVMPLLCALPGGTTNVTVNDVGIRGGLAESLLKLLSFVRRGDARARIVERSIIGVSSRDGRLLGCGLVFGAGAVVDGIEYWQNRVRARGMRSELSSGVAMARTLCGMLSGHTEFARPLALRMQQDGAQTAYSGTFRLLVVSGLQRLFLGIHPFWGDRERALYFTAIEQRAEGFARALPSILRGHPGKDVNPGAGYHSNTIDTIRLDFNGSYTLDGELHRIGNAEAPIIVAAVGRARFLRIH